MSELDASERAFLRLGPGDSADLTCTVEAPASAALHGLSSGAEAISLDTASFVDLGLGPDLVQNLVRVRRVAGAPQLAVVEAGEARLAFAGKVRPFHVDAPEGMELEPAWLVGADASRVVAHVTGDDIELALRFDAGRLNVLRLDRRAPVPTIATPPIHAVVPRDACEPWLLEDVEPLMASTALEDQAVGLGLVARLWTPPHGRATAYAGRQGPAPTRAVEAWARTLPVQVLDQLERAAMPRLQRLRAALRALEDQVAADPAQAAAAVRSIVHARDDLESLLLVLRASGRGAVLAARLAQVDTEARVQLTALGVAAEEVLDDPRVAAVGWQEPDAWWGLLAGS